MVSPVGPGSIGLTDKQYQNWLEYRNAGGLLSLHEWVDAGEPTATEEQAANAWLPRADAWLNSLVELGEDKGGISEAEYDIAIQDLIDRLYGKGKYVGKRQTTLELPQAIVSNVERYWAGLPVAARKKAEAEAKAQAEAERQAQQQRQDIAAQRMELPLYAGGTKEQQIIAGQRAIRNLQIQRQDAPQHLQSEIQNQIEELERGVNQIRESINMELLLRSREREEPKPILGNEPLPNAVWFAEKYGMSPKAAQQTGMRYAANPGSEEFETLTLAEKQDLAGVGIEIESANRLSQMPPTVVPFRPPAEFEQTGITTGPLAWKSWFQQHYPSIVERYGQQTEEVKTYIGWNEFLEKERARLKEEFASRSAYARGERPGAFQPRIKTVAF